jgi:hypothetical protein
MKEYYVTNQIFVSTLIKANSMEEAKMIGVKGMDNVINGINKAGWEYEYDDGIEVELNEATIYKNNEL